MSEELRFFLRTAGYTTVVATIYWFVSYEKIGTALLGALALSAIIFVVVVAISVPRTRQLPDDITPTSVAGRANSVTRRYVGFEDHPDDEEGGPMTLEEDLFPTSSIWPLVLALACTMIGLGLIYGAWLWAPGAGLFVAAGASWLTQLNP